MPDKNFETISPSTLYRKGISLYELLISIPVLNCMFLFAEVLNIYTPHFAYCIYRIHRIKDDNHKPPFTIKVHVLHNLPRLLFLNFSRLSSSLMGAIWLAYFSSSAAAVAMATSLDFNSSCNLVMMSFFLL